jgi:hypothetical protein
MPEVAVAKDNDLLSGKHDIGSTWQSCMVKSIAESSSPELSPERKLAPCVSLLARTASSGGGLLGCGSQVAERRSSAGSTHRPNVPLGSLRGHPLRQAMVVRPLTNTAPTRGCP